jgi:hypothetical protein
MDSSPRYQHFEFIEVRDYFLFSSTAVAATTTIKFNVRPGSTFAQAKFKCFIIT